MYSAYSAVKAIEGSDETFKSIQELLKNAIFLKQQIKFEETRKGKKDSSGGGGGGGSGQSSVYKRLSAHITLDLPDLPDLSGVVRETTNRVEHMMSQARQSHGGGGGGGSGTEQLQRSHTTLH